MLSIVLCGILFGAGLIFAASWLVTIGIVGLPVALIWGLVATGPGSSHNPYQQH